MKVHAVSLDHRTCPLEIRERVSVCADARPESGIFGLLDGPRPTGVVVLSTCNRFEVYAHFDSGEGGLLCSSAYRSLAEFIAARSGLSQAVFLPYVKRYGGRGAVEHLARVAAGLESAVIGEPEILGQTAAALERSIRDGDASPVLTAVFQAAVRVGRRARSETGIGRGSASFATAIADVVAHSCGERAFARVVIAGFGTIGRQALRVLSKRGSEVVLVNRSKPSGDDAAEFPVCGMDELPRLIPECDAVILATSSSHAILSGSTVSAAMRARGGRSLVIVDAGVPRNVDPSAASIDGVTLVNLDGLRRRMESVMETRRGAVADVESIISEEIDEFGYHHHSDRDPFPLILISEF